MAERDPQPEPESTHDDVVARLARFRAADSPSQADRATRDRLMYDAGFAAGKQARDEASAPASASPKAAPEQSPVKPARVEPAKPARVDREDRNDDLASRFWKTVGIVSTMAAAIVLTWNWWPTEVGPTTHVLQPLPPNVNQADLPGKGISVTMPPPAISLKQLALALVDYRFRNKQWIERVSTDGEGKPLLSWRVHLLPHLPGGEPLYRQFHLDEPWDSEHNMTLIPLMPSIYRHANLPGDEPGQTRLLAPVGKRSMFNGTAIADAVLAGPNAENTLMLIVGEPAVAWTSPDDWTVNEEDFTEGLLVVEGKALVAMADGSVQELPIVARPVPKPQAPSQGKAPSKDKESSKDNR